MTTTTVGQLLVNSVLPEDMRDYGRTLNNKSMKDLLSEVAKRHPSKYNDISFKLNQIGRDVATSTGGTSFGLLDIMKTDGARSRRAAVKVKMKALLDQDDLSDDSRNEKLLQMVKDVADNDRDEILKETLAENNPLGVQIIGSGRGNRDSLASIRGSDWTYEDHRGRSIP